MIDGEEICLCRRSIAWLARWHGHASGIPASGLRPRPTCPPRQSASMSTAKLASTSIIWRRSPGHSSAVAPSSLWTQMGEFASILQPHYKTPKLLRKYNNSAEISIHVRNKYHSRQSFVLDHSGISC